MAAGDVNVRVTEDITATSVSSAIATAISETSTSAAISLTPIGMGQNMLITAVQA